MKVTLGEYPEDQKFTERAILVIVLLPVDDASTGGSSDRPAHAVGSPEELVAANTAVQSSLATSPAAVRPHGVERRRRRGQGGLAELEG
jgi:hypothetical protein